MYPRFQPDVFHLNFELVQQVEELATKKGCTPAQLAINWVRSLSDRRDMPLVVPIPGATRPEMVVENTRIIHLTDEEIKEIDATLSKFEIIGRRFPNHIAVDT